MKSSRDVGTLVYVRNLFSRSNVKQSVKDGFAPAEDLFLKVFTAYIMAAFIDYAGMPDVCLPPSNVPVPEKNSTPEQKLWYLDKVIGPFDDGYCLILQNVEDAIKLQNEQRNQQNALCPDTSTVPHTILPGTLSFIT